MIDIVESTANEILDVMLDFGEELLLSGGEVNRVEDSLSRLGYSYGAKKMDVFVISSNIVITFKDKDDKVHTQTRRILKSADTDFNKLEKLNNLSRDICKNNIDIFQFKKRLKAISKIQPSNLKLCLGSMISAGAFTLFFGGNIIDSAVSVIFGMVIFFIKKKFNKFCPNTMIFNLFTSFIVGIGIVIVSDILKLNADKIIIGDIMLLIPGIAFTNAIKNILIGDTITGSIGIIETVLWACSLALGFTLAVFAIGGLNV